MSDSDVELNKYKIPMMTGIFKGLTWPIFKTLCYECYLAWQSTSLLMVELPHFQWSNIKNLFFVVADMHSHISLIRLCAVQPLSNYLAAV